MIPRAWLCAVVCALTSAGFAQTEAEVALAEVGARLAAATRPVSRSVQWRVTLAKDLAAATAYAYEDGRIVVSPALLRVIWRDDSDDALLAGVLAHEMAHVQLRHHERLKEALARRSQGLPAQTLRRDLEYEADRCACGILDRAGYAPHALADGLARLIEAQVTPAGVPVGGNRLMLDHPALVERFNRLQERMAEVAGAGRLFNFALLAIRCGRTELAERCFTRLTELLPNSAEVWHNLGLCEHLKFLHEASPRALGDVRPSLCPLYLMGIPKTPGRPEHLEAAVKHYRKSLRLAPNQSLTRSHLAVALCYLEDEAALRTAQEAAATAGAAEFNNLGFVLHRLGRRHEAIEAYNAACARALPYRFYDSAVFNRALAREDLGESAEAARDWCAYLQRNMRGRWARMARRHLVALKAPELGEPGAAEWVRKRFPEPARAEALEPPKGLTLWDSYETVIGQLGPPPETQHFPEQQALLLHYAGREMALLFDGDMLVAIEARGGLAEQWLESQSADLPPDAEQAVRKLLGEPDMRRTDSDGSRWLGYGSVGFVVYFRAEARGGRRLASCAFVPPTDVFVEG